MANQAQNYNYNCSCNRTPNYKPMSKEQMLKKIYEVSFAVDDIILFLDTHPCDDEALEYFNRQVEIRQKLLKEYAKYYGPLTLDTANLNENGKWQWVLQPWPWENKGGCR